MRNTHAVKWKQLALGHLSHNKFWGEDPDAQYHSVVASSTLVQEGDINILVDPTLPVDAFEIGESKGQFPRFADTQWLYLHDVYCYATYLPGVKENMRLIPPHRHSPPEDAYPTNITHYPAFTVGAFDKGLGVYIPWKPGADHYHYGFPHMSNFMADLLENALGIAHVTGNLPEMVEVEHTIRRDGSVQYVHLINYTGHSLKSYFRPIPIHDLVAELPWNGDSPKTAYSMTREKAVRFACESGVLRLFVDTLILFEAIKLV